MPIAVDSESVDELHQRCNKLRAAAVNARRDIEDISRRRSAATETLKDLRERRCAAGAAAAGGLGKRQLAEIKQLARNPPEAIRRVLSAAWLLLHCGRFTAAAGGPGDGACGGTIHFDEVKDWSRCQKMLADDCFVKRIMNFAADELLQAPHVPSYVAATYFGLGANSGLQSASSERENEAPHVHLPAIHSSTSPTPLGSPGSAKDMLRVSSSRRGSAVMPPRRSSSASHGVGRVGHTSFSSQSGSSPTSLKARATTMMARPPLDVETVTYASEPCGALATWMLELLREHLDGGRLRKELMEMEAKLDELNTLVKKSDLDLAEAEAALASLRERAAAKAAADAEAEALERAARHLREVEAKADATTVAATTTPATRKLALQVANVNRPLPMEAVNVEMGGVMAHIMRELAQLRVPFDEGVFKVLGGDAEQALVLPRLADALKEHGRSGALKLVLEGHRECKERDGGDIERSLAVYQWLVEIAGVTPGLMRIKGLEASQGTGRCVVPVPLEELAASRGPIPEEIRSCSTRAKPGLYFAASSAAPYPETRAIAHAMADWMDEEDGTFKIEGHTSQDEPDELALQRALAVRDLLVGRGVRKSRLKTKACKHLHPISRRHQALNRRVELYAE